MQNAMNAVQHKLLECWTTNLLLKSPIMQFFCCAGDLALARGQYGCAAWPGGRPSMWNGSGMTLALGLLSSSWGIQASGKASTELKKLCGAPVPSQVGQPGALACSGCSFEVPQVHWGMPHRQEGSEVTAQPRAGHTLAS